MQIFHFLGTLIEALYRFLWGPLFVIRLQNLTIEIPLLVLLLIPTGIYFTIRTRAFQIRLFPEMLRISVQKSEWSAREKDDAKTQRVYMSGIRTLLISTATRVGMGNLVGVVAAISAGGAGAVFWMWISALIGSSTAFIEATLAQLHRKEDPLYGGYRGGPAYYIHDFMADRFGKAKRRSLPAVLFALSALICWCGISQVISNSITSSTENAFHVPPAVSALILTILAALIVLKKDATVKVLDLLVPIMASVYFALTIFLICKNITVIPRIFSRIFQEAFGLRQIAGGTFGAVLMNGIKRGLFSNEAGSGSAPCASASAESDHPAKIGLFQALGVFIDTILLCSCTAMLVLMVPEEVLSGLSGMDLMQAAMNYHLGSAGGIFIAVILWLFSFSTFIGILFYARPNVAYLFGDSWRAQTLYKILALFMLFVGGLTAYTVVWDLGDVGVGLMTVFNIAFILPMSGEALAALKDYEGQMRERKKASRPD